MADEKDLASPNYYSTVSGAAGTTMMVQAARKSPPWLRYLLYAFAAITALVTVAGLIDRVTSVGSLPACDAKTTRDTLSDLNKQNKFNASKYNFIKNVGKTDTEVTCTASLALKAGGNVEYDFRIFKDGGAVKVKITEIRR
ncbi:hypothetical protein [Bradyrhizobium sp.]|uniref:hypothetical protein n=1 Tax=Bradyrhizobium sp. TaxID=376 RepID=UPI0040379E35